MQTQNCVFICVWFWFFPFFYSRKSVSKIFKNFIWIVQELSSSFPLQDLQGCADWNLSPPECLKQFPPWSPWDQSPSVCSSHSGIWGQQTHLCTQGTSRRRTNKISWEILFHQLFFSFLLKGEVGVMDKWSQSSSCFVFLEPMLWGA